MTTIGIHSDMHLELQSEHPDWLTTVPDILILAGDVLKIDDAAEFLKQLSKEFTGMQIIYVAGNHEFYRNYHMKKAELNLYAELDDEPHIHFLQCDVIEVSGIRFLGCTGWSQMLALGSDRQQAVMDSAGVRINDFYIIGFDGKRFSAEDCVELGNHHRQWLEQELSNTTDLPTVVITHFSPSIDFGNPNYPVDNITAYFCSNYGDLIEKYQPAFWIFGHTHFNLDTMVGSCRVISNQQGYGQECVNSYEPNKLIEL